MQSHSSHNCIHHYNIKIFNIFDPEILLINTKPGIKNKLKELLSEMKKFKVHTIFILDYKKRNDFKIFHSSTKLIAIDSDIDEAFRCMHQIIMTKRKNYASEDWIVLDLFITHSIRIFDCLYKEKNNIKNGDNK